MYDVRVAVNRRLTSAQDNLTVYEILLLRWNTIQMRWSDRSNVISSSTDLDLEPCLPWIASCVVCDVCMSLIFRATKRRSSLSCAGPYYFSPVYIFLVKVYKLSTFRCRGTCNRTLYPLIPSNFLPSLFSQSAQSQFLSLSWHSVSFLFASCRIWEACENYDKVQRGQQLYVNDMLCIFWIKRSSLPGEE